MDRQSTTTSRDYSDISPSAKALILLKGLTDIPYARATAELVSRPEAYVPDLTMKDFSLWIRTLHFEVRYKSINQLLDGLAIKNILELSSGFSFRGLETIQHENVYYIDTDLPDLIKTKQAFVTELQKDILPQGKLEVLPLNALDKDAFEETAQHFPAGPIAIVNEGLLMYLELDEKRKLCKIIRDLLKERGGYWITADIYIRTAGTTTEIKMDDKLTDFLKQQRVDEKMFESFEDAEAFFKSEGFIMEKEAEPDYANSGSLKYLMASAAEEQLMNLGKAGKIHATWRLKLAN